MADREFEHAVEHEPATMGGATVEAEDKLVEVRLQVRCLDRTLVGAEQPPLGERGDPVNGGEQLVWVLAAAPCGALATAVMDVAQVLDAAVAPPAVGDNRGPARRWPR